MINTVEPYGYNRLRPYPNHLLWHINDLCNFSCTYCFFPTGLKDPPEVGRLSPQEISQRFDDTGKQWAIFIGGGEPMLYPKFNELINLLKKKHYIQISTNLYNKNTVAFAEQVSPDHIININASSHLLYHTDKSRAKFLENYHLYKTKGFDISVSYVFYPAMFKRMKDDFAFLKSEGVDIIIPLTYQGMYEGKRYPGSYTPEELELLRDHVQEPLELMVAMDKMKFQNKMCKAGSTFFFMDIKGDVSKCATINESHGNIFEGTFRANDKPTPCPVAQCNDACFGIISQIDEPRAPAIELVSQVMNNAGVPELQLHPSMWQRFKQKVANF
jgi:MoaA/NifB/PqqE/SkfB family radical SAM enzyme